MLSTLSTRPGFALGKALGAWGSEGLFEGSAFLGEKLFTRLVLQGFLGGLKHLGLSAGNWPGLEDVVNHFQVDLRKEKKSETQSRNRYDTKTGNKFNTPSHNHMVFNVND